MSHLRTELPEDREAIHTLTDRAFGTPGEAKLIDALREAGAVVLSMVALDGDQVVGHILFSPISIVGDSGRQASIALAPMSVHPNQQRQGIGSQLVSAGLEEIRELGHDSVIVLGHPEYYPRFGFVPASRYGIRCPFPVDDDVFMALELQAGALADAAGVVRYHSAFDGI